MTIVAILIALIAIGVATYSIYKVGEAEKKMGEIGEVDSLLIFVNSGMDKPFNQYASLAIAFTAKTVYKVPEVTVYYGPNGVEMAKKGTLAQLPIDDNLGNLIASQFEGLTREDLPTNLEDLARFEKEELGVNFASCATFHVVNGFADTVGDTTNIEDFVAPVKIPDAVGAALGADKTVVLS
jgi:predicted peroxiredoxin